MVIKERQKNLCATLQEIGTKSNCSRQYVHEILAGCNLPTKKYIPKYLCNNCGIVIPKMNKYFCSEKCEKEFILVPLICDQCGETFKRRQGDIRGALRFNNSDKKWFCTKKCYGAYVGIHYGFVAHPENIIKNHHNKRIERILEGRRFNEISIVRNTRKN